MHRDAETEQWNQICIENLKFIFKLDSHIFLKSKRFLISNSFW